MAFVYALVSRGKVVLAEFTLTSGNFEQVVRLLLPKLESSPSKQSIDTGEKHRFHALIDDARGLFYICLCEKHISSQLAFRFLFQVQTRFETDLAEQVDVENAIAYSCNKQFSPVLGDLISAFNESSRSSTNTSQVREQLEEVKDIMRTNIDSLLNRGERIELLVESTDRMAEASVMFHESATRLQNLTWWNSAQAKIILYSTTALVLLFFTWFLFF